MFQEKNIYGKAKIEVSETNCDEISACTISLPFSSLSVLESFYRQFQMPPILFILQP
jgi:hypothetical protein